MENFGPDLPLLFKYTKFGKLFLRKVIKIVATRCLDFSSKRLKMRLAAGLCPDPLGELTALPRPPSWIKGALLLKGRGNGEGKGRGKGGRGRGGEGRKGGRGGKGPSHLTVKAWLRLCIFPQRFT